MNPTNDPYMRYRQPAPQPAPQRRLSPWLIRLPLLGVTAVLLLIFLSALFVALHQLQYQKLIYPGVSAYGAQLSGMTRDQAIAALAARYTYADQTIFTFRDGGKVWQKSAKDLGVAFDVEGTVDKAFEVGRGSGLITNLLAQGNAWLNGAAIQPVVVFDQSKAVTVLDQIGGEINRPVLEATLLLRGTNVTTTAGQIGRQLDAGATLAKVRDIVLNMSTGGEIPLIIHETAPRLLSAEEPAAQVRAAIASSIQVFIPSADQKDPGPWEATPDFLASLLSIKRVDADTGTHYEISTNMEALRAFLNKLAPTLRVDAQSARFVFNDTTRDIDVIQDSVNGRDIDLDATIEGFSSTLFRKENRRVPIVFKTVVPPVNSNSKAKDLGITEKVVESTTYFYGSTPERRTNIQVAASRFHGLVIAPGEEFSFNKYLGDVSPETGFETGLVIFGDRTIQGVGGGVCQVSTTIFQAAFFAGFPIKERYAHGYRVGYYESGKATANGQNFRGGVGLDATVYSPLIDLKWVNDTPYYLLMEAYFQASQQSLTFKFYSTGTGRSVSVTSAKLSNPVAAGSPKYTESATMQPGQTRQIDYAVDGVDVHVFRTVKQGDKTLIDNEDIYSHYLPWSAQYLVAPGERPRG